MNTDIDFINIAEGDKEFVPASSFLQDANEHTISKVASIAAIALFTVKFIRVFLRLSFR